MKKTLISKTGLFVGSLALLAAASIPVTVSAQSILTYKGKDREAKLIAGAKKEGALTIYSALTVNQALRPLADGFQKKYPFIKVDFWRGSSRKIAQKVLAERRANSLVADVLEGSGLSQIMVKAKGVVPFSTPYANNIAKKYRDENNLWVASRFSYFGTAYNQKIIPVGTQPKTYADLLNPKWKGKIAWRIGSETGALLFISNLRMAMGEKSATAYFAELSKQGLINFKGSARTLVNRVVEGEYPLAIQIFAHHPVISAKKGAKIGVQMMQPIPSVNGTIMVPKGVKNAHAAMLFIDYYLSKAGQNVLKKARYFPVVTGINPRKELTTITPRLANLKENYVKPETLFKLRKGSQKIFKKYFKHGKTVVVKRKKKKKKNNK
jgi:iron(III) transport system substrate-binding protein